MFKLLSATLGQPKPEAPQQACASLTEAVKLKKQYNSSTTSAKSLIKIIETNQAYRRLNNPENKGMLVTALKAAASGANDSPASQLFLACELSDLKKDYDNQTLARKARSSWS